MVEEVDVEATVGEGDGAATVVEGEHEEATVLATEAEEGEEVVSLHYPFHSPQTRAETDVLLLLL